ncbi:MAG: helix-turn-helix transcriptional regulator [Oscillospiraceae bacterium]|nr:helix-turn-helix transcriptional regulator [Oscillospiraceae bacterium]
MSLFHERFKSLRDSSGKTQAKIAEDLGMTPQALSYYANGREPNYDTLIAMAEYFHVTTDYLLGVTEYKTPLSVAISDEIPLSEKTIYYLKNWPSESLHTLDSFLSDENTAWFFQDLAVYVYSLNSGVASEVAEVLAVRFMQGGTSKTAPEVVRMLATKLTPAIQQASLINALNAVAKSMSEKDNSSSNIVQEGGK